jgi:hypothetical protein
MDDLYEQAVPCSVRQACFACPAGGDRAIRHVGHVVMSGGRRARTGVGRGG